MKVFLSHSIAPDDGPVAARLRAVAAAYGIQILLPDRSVAVAGRVPPKIRQQIEGADAVVVLATEGAVVDPHVPGEVGHAIDKDKPLLALVEDGVEVDFVPEEDVVHFDRNDRAAHEAELIDALKGLQDELVAESNAQTAKAVGWLAGIAIGLVGLGAIAAALASDPDEEDDEA